MTMAALFIAWVFGGSKHYFSAVLTLAMNQKFLTSYDNYFIILIITIVSFSPEVRYIEKDNYKVSKIECKLFVRALIGLFAAAWYFGYIAPFSDFKVGTIIFELFKSNGLHFMEYLKKTFLGFLW